MIYPAFFSFPLSLHDFGNLWSSWTCTECKERTLLTICHKWSVSNMFCILIPGQDKHKVNQFSGPVLHPLNIILVFSCLFLHIYLFFPLSVFFCHLASLLQSVYASLCLPLRLCFRTFKFKGWQTHSRSSWRPLGQTERTQERISTHISQPPWGHI